MQPLVELLAKLQSTDAPASELFSLFANRLREKFGACGMALVCTEGLAADEFRILLFEDEQGNTRIDNFEETVDSHLISVQHSSNRSRLLNTNQPVVHHGKQPGIDPMFGDLFQAYIDAVSLPLFQYGGVKRWLLLLLSEQGKVEQIDVERSLLMATLAINYVFSVENARRLQKANEWINSELESVARIQRLLLPQAGEKIPGIRIASHFSPHAQVGGDYYEIVSLADVGGNADAIDASAGFMIADASGHGAAAAVEIAMFDAILRTYRPNENNGPAGVLTYANRYFFTRMLRASFITAFVSNYDQASKTLHYANAGHPSPLLRRSDGDIVMMADNEGIPLGIEQDRDWYNSTIKAGPGDLLVMYTDGITEARNHAGEEYGVERLMNVLAGCDAGANDCLSRIVSDLQQHQDNASQSDDQTLLVIEIE